MEPNEKDKEISELSGQATQYYGDKEWDKAIECLEKVLVLLRESAMIYPIATWLRLPVFLQQAGRFDEAMQEFDHLLGKSREMNAVSFSHRPKFVQEGITYSDHAAIYDRMRQCCKKQKRLDEAKVYEELSNQCSEKHKQFLIEDEKYREKESAEFRKKFNLKN